MRIEPIGPGLENGTGPECHQTIEEGLQDSIRPRNPRRWSPATGVLLPVGVGSAFALFLMTPFLGWLLSLMVAMPVISLADHTSGGGSIRDVTGPDFENIYLVVFTAMGVVAVLTMAVVVAVLPKSPGIRLVGVLAILLGGTILLVDTYADGACGIVQCVDRRPAASPTVPVTFEPRELVTNADRALSVGPPGVLAGKALVGARVVSFDGQSAGGASVRIGERGGFYYNPRDSDRLTDLGPGQSFEDWFRHDVTHRDGTESFTFEVTVRGVPPND